MHTNTVTRRRRIGIALAAAASSIALVVGVPSVAQAAALPDGLYKAPWESCVWEYSASGGRSYVSADRWKALGYPAVTTSVQFGREASFIWKNGTSSHEIFADTSRFMATPCGAHKLTFDEWRAMGAPTPVTMNAQFYRVNGSSTLYGRMFTLGETYYPTMRPINYAEWTELGFPTPHVVSRLP
ncbi:hypothetical protein GE115_10095 [Agromyces sp. CFH 90414]|uniref:Tat pathway signal sequence domain protein n=1 Tax=Agromyces agglutinans TaxID=2662258 RepID=A0A6I2F410_9MICO|nr:hypothetical protein [Agromyces agglutinans]MRG60215.1 hypothetical protein [Agromyces agglutinans]